MTSPSDAAQAFLNRLSSSDRAWLAGLWQEAMHSPPLHECQWGTPTQTLGHLPVDRATRMAGALPCTHWRGHTLIWDAEVMTSEERSACIQAFLQNEYQQGYLQHWREETYAFSLMPCIPPDPRSPAWLQAERTGFRHLGLMSHAVHIHGFLPEGELWCGRRALHKPTDPGLLDNLAAGGLPAGEFPLQAALRELHEEAGLQLLSERLFYVGSVRTRRPEPEGWHDERLLVYSLVLSPSEKPHNLDGEVSHFELYSPEQWLIGLRERQFTADAAMALVCALGMTPGALR